MPIRSEQITRLRAAQAELLPLEAAQAMPQEAPAGSAAPLETTALRIILEFAQPPDLVAIGPQIEAATGLRVHAAPLMEAHGLPSEADDALARFVAVTVPGVASADIADQPFELAYAFAEATGALTAEPELGTSFFLIPPDGGAGREGETGLEGVDGFPPGCWVEEAQDPTAHVPRWALNAIRAPQAWTVPPAPGGKARGAGARVFQPDTGVADHVELEGGMLDLATAYDFVENRSGAHDPMNYSGNPGHGTGTASVVASREAGNMVGVAPEASLTPLRAIESVIVLDHGRVAAAVEHARRSGADVITMSLGGAWSSALRAAMGRAIADGVIVLAAAGNCVIGVVWPARYAEVIAVAGSNIQDAPWRGSCRGSEVDITAPGEFTPRANRAPANHGSSTDVRGGQGTSFAVAMTAGAAALWVAHHGRAAIRHALNGGTVQGRFAGHLQDAARRPAGFDTANFGAGIVDAQALLLARLDKASEVTELAFDAPEVVADSVHSLRTLLAESLSQEESPLPNLMAVASRMDDGDLRRFAAELSHIALRRRLGDRSGETESPGAPDEASPTLRRALAARREAAVPGGLEEAVEAAPPADREGLAWLAEERAREARLEGPPISGRPSSTPISARAFDMVVEFEVTSQNLYERRYRRPIWPGVASGVTVGIGYDVGYASLAQLRDDWRGAVADGVIQALESALGVTGEPARALATALAGEVDIGWAPALAVHRGKVIPRWVGLVERALPNTSRLSPDSLGALVSLTYNRGASYSMAGPRYEEMRNIRAHMVSGAFERIPQEMLQMQRLWPDVAGLRLRRAREAELFEFGLLA